MNKNGIVEIQAAIDWITLTGDSFTAWEKVQEMAVSLVREATEAGFKTYYQSRHGFRMNCVSGIQYGSGAGNWMVVLTSGFAAKYWMPFAAYAKNVTRIDLQSTIWYNSDQIETIGNLYMSGLNDSPKLNRRDLTYIANGKKGDTLYVGSRSSQQFGRVYDKGRQSGNDPHYLNALRYEVEYKKPLSGAVCRWMLDENPNADQITARVFDWFSSRYIQVPQVSTSAISAIQSPREETPIDRKLEWLRKTVRPVYRQLRMLDWQTEADNAIGVTEEIETYHENQEN